MEIKEIVQEFVRSEDWMYISTRLMQDLVK